MQRIIDFVERGIESGEMEMDDFEIGFLASSRQVAHLLFGGPCRVVSGRVGGLLFRIHS